MFIYNVEFHIESKITYIRTQSSREKQNTNVYGFRNNIGSVIPSIFNVFLSLHVVAEAFQISANSEVHLPNVGRFRNAE